MKWPPVAGAVTGFQSGGQDFQGKRIIKIGTKKNKREEHVFSRPLIHARTAFSPINVNNSA